MTSALKLDGLSLAVYGSQGQQRTAVLALKVAEYAVLRERARRSAAAAARRRALGARRRARGRVSGRGRRLRASLHHGDARSAGSAAGRAFGRKSPTRAFKRTRRAEALGGDLGDGSRRRRLREIRSCCCEAGWSEIVGSKRRSELAPFGIAQGTLTIVTRSSAWSHQLSFLGEHVLRAVQARLPSAGVARLRFRVGRLAERTASGPGGAQGRSACGAAPAARRAGERGRSARALSRRRRTLEPSAPRRRLEGVRGLRALVAPRATALRGLRFRARSKNARQRRRACSSRRRGSATPERRRSLTGYEKRSTSGFAPCCFPAGGSCCCRLGAAKQLSRDGRERLVASSYVLLRSKIAPEDIMPATVRSILGDELNELLYETPSHKGDALRNKKRTT